jgi:hypothetical protein
MGKQTTTKGQGNENTKMQEVVMVPFRDGANDSTPRSNKFRISCSYGTTTTIKATT